MERESQLERWFVGQVHIRGALARKFASPSQRGAPDRVVIWPGGVVHFVELKTEIGRLTKLQAMEHKRLKNRGCEVFTLYGRHGINRYLADVDIQQADQFANFAAEEFSQCPSNKN